ncbi:FtsX-like permease family protein [Nannocystis sp.]|uniref:ABC transporter permease n=1 Tax=Nannocystis sp. TaxID=1962667 RepID=UPI0025FE7600|nr:FtsX-like permease family protein [Nannocystis sp.]MBK7829884.1 ABC transporter permease [Nannocystis sp.]
MKFNKLTRIVGANLRSNAVHFLLASIGVIVGIAAFAFFLALGAGVRSVVLGKIFPLDQLEVVAKTLSLDLGPLSLGMASDVLDDASADKLRTIPGVRGVYPKMKLTVPAVAVGGKQLIGNDLRTELIVDGIDPGLVADEIGPAFHDPPAVTPGSQPQSCKQDKECGAGYCGRPREGGPTLVCREYVPALVSHHLVEIYNGSLRRAYSLPRLNPEFLIGLSVEMKVGASMVEASARDALLYERVKLVGFSDKAITLGLTLPRGYVAGYNVHYGTPEAATRYHSIVVKVVAKDQVAAVAKAIQELDLEVTDSGAEQAGMLITVFVLVFSLLSTIIVGIAAVNIMHVFFMLVYERQREIGIMRAVGASRGDIRLIILGEAACVGLAAGTVGVLLAWAASVGFDAVSANYVPDFPYKPTTYFMFTWDLVLLALGFAAGFCVLGAWLPARRAARMDPAAVLTGR